MLYVPIDLEFIDEYLKVKNNSLKLAPLIMVSFLQTDQSTHRKIVSTNRS